MIKNLADLKIDDVGKSHSGGGHGHRSRTGTMRPAPESVARFVIPNWPTVDLQIAIDLLKKVNVLNFYPIF